MTLEVSPSLGDPVKLRSKLLKMVKIKLPQHPSWEFEIETSVMQWYHSRREATYRAVSFPNKPICAPHFYLQALSYRTGTNQPLISKCALERGGLVDLSQ